MIKEHGKIYDIYCDKCGRYLGGYSGEENEKEAKKIYSVYEVAGEDVCYKCK